MLVHGWSSARLSVDENKRHGDIVVSADEVMRIVRVRQLAEVDGGHAAHGT